MIRVLNGLILVVVVALSVAIYDLKYRIQAQEKNLSKVEQEILNEEDAIRILRAEYSYLTQPERLQKLADRHLLLKPMQASQIAGFDDLPLPPQEDDFFGPGGNRHLGGYAGTIVGAPSGVEVR